MSPPMTYGILSLVNHDLQRRGSDAEILRDQVAQAVLAETLGLDSFWIAEGLERLAPLLQTYSEAYAAAGHPPEHRRIQGCFHLVLAEETETARQAAAPPLTRYLESFARAWECLQMPSEDYASYREALSGIQKLSFAGLYERRRVIVGTPTEAVAQLRYIQATTPLTDFTFLVDFGLLDRALVQQTIRLLATEVVPLLR